MVHFHSQVLFSNHDSSLVGPIRTSFFRFFFTSVNSVTEKPIFSWIVTQNIRSISVFIMLDRKGFSDIRISFLEPVHTVHTVCGSNLHIFHVRYCTFNTLRQQSIYLNDLPSTIKLVLPHFYVMQRMGSPICALVFPLTC